MWDHMLQTVSYCVVTRLVQCRTGISKAKVAASPKLLTFTTAPPAYFPMPCTPSEVMNYEL